MDAIENNFTKGYKQLKNDSESAKTNNIGAS